MLHSNINVIIYRDKVTFGTVLLYGLFSFAVIGFDECYSLWSATSTSIGMYNQYSYKDVFADYYKRLVSMV